MQQIERQRNKSLA